MQGDQIDDQYLIWNFYLLISPKREDDEVELW